MKEDAINHLYLSFPSLQVKRNNGKVSTVRIPVVYEIKGTREEAVSVLNEIEGEWKFTDVQIDQVTENVHRIHVEYQVKPDEVLKFLDSVPYRNDLEALNNAI
ncbi:hypothetical protein ACFYU8_18425 [Brevibacillus sp. NPDC003359]|uniref:hypothetical protein n=1 Tax=unclassified Brevibacillus TaxID=2684853 RepID=UPI00368226B1